MITPPFPPLDPILYHAHHLLRADDLPFWQSLAKEFGGPILELGCGTGRILLSLANDDPALSGLMTAGLDTDPQMLAFLRASLSPQASPPPTLYQADMRSFQLPDRFALTILPCNTYSTFPAEERIQIAQAVHRHLQPEGLFAVSIPNPDLLASLDEFSDFDLEETFPHPQTGYPVEVFSQWEKTRETLTFHWRYDHLYPNGNTISQLATTTHHLDAPEMYQEELQRAGLIPIALYGDYERNPFDPENSTYLIILAQNQTP